jgi:hypothetical protein
MLGKGQTQKHWVGAGACPVDEISWKPDHLSARKAADVTFVFLEVLCLIG